MAAREETPGRGRRIAGLAAAIIVVAGGWAAMSRSGAPRPETATVHREDLPLVVEASGELDAVRSSLIGPPGLPSVWDYKIASMAAESAQVKRGDPILSFDTTGLQDELQKRKVEYDQAVKDLEKREVDLSIELKDLELKLAESVSRLGKQRLKAQAPESLVEANTLQIAKLDLALAEKEVESLKRKAEATRVSGQADEEAFAEKRDRAAARIKELEDGIEKMSVRAPQDGIVIYQTDWQGDKFKVGDSVWRALKVMKIPDLTEMIGKAEVDEPDAGRLAQGQPVVVRLDALPDAEFEGRVKTIGRVVQKKPREASARFYAVEISLGRSDPARMRPGMRLRAEIEVDRAAGALVVPRDAVFLRESGPVLFRKTAFGFTETPVKIGRRSARLVEILDGAAEGDVVSRRDLARPNGSAPRRAPGGPSA